MQLRWFLAISRMRFVSPPFIKERPFFRLLLLSTILSLAVSLTCQTCLRAHDVSLFVVSPPSDYVRHRIAFMSSFEEDEEKMYCSFIYLSLRT